MDWDLYKIYTDPGYTGANTNRPGLQALITDIRLKRINIVLVYKLDRLSRSQKDALFLIEDVFLLNNVNFVSISENFDTSTAFGRAMVGILAVFAQLERETIRERMSLGKTARAKSGQWNGSIVTPIGYDYIPGVGLVVNEYEAVTIRKIFDWYTTGVNVQEIFSRLKDVSSRYGHYSYNEIRRILRNPAYGGYLRSKTGALHKGKHEPIIDDKVYQKAVAIIEENHEIWETNVRGARFESMLAGIIFCARCGARYHKHRWSTKSPYIYACYSRSKKRRNYVIDPNCKNKHWLMEELDNLVLNEIKSLAIDKQALVRLVDGQKTPQTADTKTLQKQLSKLKKQRSKYMDLYSLDDLSIDAVKEKLEPINAQIDKLEKEIEIMEPQEREAKNFIPTIQASMKLIDKATLEEKRQIVLALIRRIDIDGEDLTIQWRI